MKRYLIWNKTLLLTMVALMVWGIAKAEDYRILFINSSTINIGDKELKKGDVFSDKEIINWKSKDMAIKVMNLKSHKVLVLSAQEKTASENKCLADYLMQNMRLSSRDLAEDLCDSEEYLLDSLLIQKADNADVSHYVMEYRMFGKRKRVELPVVEEKYLVINRDVFENTRLIPILVNIFCVFDNSTETIPYIKDLKLILLPLDIDS